MTLVVSNLFGIVSGTLIMLFVNVVLQSRLLDGPPARGYLLIPFIFGWIVAILITNPRRSTTVEVLDRGLILGAIEWGLAFPAAFIVVLTSVRELEAVGSADLIGYVLGGLIVGGGVTLLGAGLFTGLRFMIRHIVTRQRARGHEETG